MKKYEIPLRVNRYHSITVRTLSTVRMMFDAMSEEEMREPAPVDDVEDILQSYPDMDIGEYFNRLLDADLSERLESIDGEGENIPKNYDVAIALSGEQLNEANNLMECLTRMKKAKNQLDLDDIEACENFEEHARKMANLILEQREGDVKDSIIQGENEKD